MRIPPTVLSPREEAENCRRQAVAYVGKPEMPFLLRVAAAFDQIGSSDLVSSGRKAGSTLQQE